MNIPDLGLMFRFRRQTANKDQPDQKYHKTLVRQIGRHLGSGFLHPGLFHGKHHELFKAISETYAHLDEDRILMERSLELSSKELTHANTDLNRKLQVLDERSRELEKLNKYMFGRELRMAELKKEVERLKELLKQHNIDIPKNDI